jgi:hypothetical protein
VGVPAPQPADHGRSQWRVLLQEEGHRCEKAVGLHHRRQLGCKVPIDTRLTDRLEGRSSSVLIESTEGHG